MQLPDNFNLTLSKGTISKIIIIVFPIILGTGYAGVTFYNKMLDTIEASEGLSDIKQDIKELKLQVSAIKERQMEGLDANIRLQEKAADAYVLSKEASAISKATQRELTATSENLKSEVKTMIKSVEDKLDVIKRATTNPLDRR
jgi:hypothetical protein